MLKYIKGVTMKSLKINGQVVVDIRGMELFFENVDMLVDFLWMCRFKFKSNSFIIDKKMVGDYFFVGDLELAKEMRQKCRKFESVLMIVGDFDKTNKELDEFIYTCNNGKHLFLVDSYQQGYQLLKDTVK